MSSVNKKRMKTQEAANEEDPVVFKILHGTLKASDYAAFHLLVPEDSIEDLAEALREAEESLFVWTIGDEEITDIQTIPPTIAHPVRSLGKIPTDKSESELLDWLIHGESFFSKKYIILTFVHRQYGVDDGYNRVHAYEIRNKEHVEKLVDALDKIENSTWDIDEGTAYLGGYEVIDRGEYLRKFDNCTIVDDNLVEALEGIAEYEEDEYIVEAFDLFIRG